MNSGEFAEAEEASRSFDWAGLLSWLWLRVRMHARGAAPGALAVFVFSVGILVASFRASDEYYENHLVAADTSYYLAGPALIVSGKHDYSFKRLLRDPAPLHSSDGGTEVYVLQTIAAWYLRAFLPLRPAMAVVLNGVWFVCMAQSVYALLWSRIRRRSAAALATVGFLVTSPFSTSPLYGLTAMDPSFVGFMLGTSALCCVILSERFRRPLPCLLAGFFLGALVLGRVYTLGILVPAMLPYVLACFWRRPRNEMLESVWGGTLTISVTAAVCGWWVRRYWRLVLAYPTQYGTDGVLNRTRTTDALLDWLHFPRDALGANLALLCVLSWPLAAGLFGPGKKLRSFNWAALWVGLAPLLVLAKIGTTFHPYGAIALFGVFLLLLLPFAPAELDPLIGRRRFAAVLSLACALGVWSFFGKLRTSHQAKGSNKAGIVAALKDLRTQARSRNSGRVALGLVHWGALHDASLVNALIFDVGVRVATSGYPPRHLPKDTLVVEVMGLDPWAWNVRLHGASAVTADAWAEQLQKADYVLVLAGSARQDRRPGLWKQWLDASDRLREMKTFRPLGSPFTVAPDGPVQLLAQKR